MDFWVVMGGIVLDVEDYGLFFCLCMNIKIFLNESYVDVN